MAGVVKHGGLRKGYAAAVALPKHRYDPTVLLLHISNAKISSGMNICWPAMKYAVEVVLAIHAVVLPSSSSSHNGEGTGCGNGYHLCVRNMCLCCRLPHIPNQFWMGWMS